MDELEKNKIFIRGFLIVILALIILVLCVLVPLDRYILSMGAVLMPLPAKKTGFLAIFC